MGKARSTERSSALLLETLRAATGRPRLDFQTPPTPLTGGFYAEMLRFRLADPPDGLEGELVARIVPYAPAGAWESTIQRHVADQGFPTPRVHLTVDEHGPLGRFLTVMDLVEGHPPLAGLTLTTVLRQTPALVRHLPEQLAGVAARLHTLDPEPLVAELKRLDSPFPMTTAGFVEAGVTELELLGRTDLARAGSRLLDTQPRSSASVIAHGDLHPFNLLVPDHGANGELTLIDWTVARVADPAFTLAFTDLTLSNPPIARSTVGRRALRPLARAMSARFLRTYRDLTAGTAGEVDDANLDWHRKVHALRILVELAGWDALDARPTGHHPWFVLEPVARNLLDVPT